MNKEYKMVEVNGVWLPQLVEVENDETVAMQDTRTYEQKVESLIRAKYSLNDELAILRQRETKTQEFQEYFEFVEKCKSVAK